VSYTKDPLVRYEVSLVDVEYYQKTIKCQWACPVKTDVSGYVNAVADKDYQTGYVMARQPNPFSSVCGRICVAPCEEACRRSDVDVPVQIRALKRFLSERHGVESKGPGPKGIELLLNNAPGNSRTAESVWSLNRTYGALKEQNGTKSVAIVGAGAGGLTTAHDLRLMGYRVTVLESFPVLGGALRSAIPEYRLPHDILDAEIQDIINLGMEVRTNVMLDRDFTIADLKREGFNAVLIATGPERSRKHASPKEGVFALGEFGQGTIAVIDTIGAGHRAAIAIDEFLRKKKARIVKRGWLTPVEPEDYLSFGYDYLTWPGETPPHNTFETPQTPGCGHELEEPYPELMARRQGARCLKCHIQTVFHGEKCIQCNGCVDICPWDCLKMVSLSEIAGDESLNAVIEAKYGYDLKSFQERGGDVEFLSQGSVMLKDDSVCTRCALCYKRCPTGAITMELFEFSEEIVFEDAAEVQMAAAVAAGGSKS